MVTIKLIGARPGSWSKQNERQRATSKTAAGLKLSMSTPGQLMTSSSSNIMCSQPGRIMARNGDLGEALLDEILPRVPAPDWAEQEAGWQRPRSNTTGSGTPSLNTENSPVSNNAPWVKVLRRSSHSKKSPKQVEPSTSSSRIRVATYIKGSFRRAVSGSRDTRTRSNSSPRREACTSWVDDVALDKQESNHSGCNASAPVLCLTGSHGAHTTQSNTESGQDSNRHSRCHSGNKVPSALIERSRLEPLIVDAADKSDSSKTRSSSMHNLTAYYGPASIDAETTSLANSSDAGDNALPTMSEDDSLTSSTTLPPISSSVQHEPSSSLPPLQSEQSFSLPPLRRPVSLDRPLSDASIPSSPVSRDSLGMLRKLPSLPPFTLPTDATPAVACARLRKELVSLLNRLRGCPPLSTVFTK